MATESSAVVRFINLVQQQRQPIESTALPGGDLTTDFVEQLRPTRSKAPLAILGATLFAASAAAGGIYIGKRYIGSEHGGSSSANATRSVAAALTPGAPVMTTTPTTTPTPSPTPAPAAAPAPAASAVDLAQTGFDIRVKPAGALVSLDGKEIGKAPLRVRNLAAGAHVVDVEAPAGYFSRRVDVSLTAGQPENLNLVLDPTGDQAVASTGPAPAPAAQPAAPAEATDDAPAASEPSRRAGRHGRHGHDKAPAAAVPAAAAKSAKEPKEHDHARNLALGDVVEHPTPAAAKDEPAAAPQPAVSSDSGAKGTLMLGSKPLCDIYIDGKNTGLKTPQTSIELAAGAHHVQLVNEELGVKKKFKVVIAPGKTTRAVQDFTAGK